MSGSDQKLDAPVHNNSVSLCLEQLKAGDQDAVQLLWERYYHRLVALARKKLGDSSRRSADENDVVQNAFIAFCLSAQAGRFPDLQDRENLWSLLALITARTAAKQRSHESRAKRGGGRVSHDSATSDPTSAGQLVQVISEEPSAEAAALFVAQLEDFMDSLDDPTDRLILLWKMEDRNNPEIARLLDCSLSAVERRLRQIRKRLGSVIELA